MQWEQERQFRRVVMGYRVGAKRLRQKKLRGSALGWESNPTMIDENCAAAFWRAKLVLWDSTFTVQLYFFLTCFDRH